MKKLARPGWYPDPSGAKEQRYYDGTKWTENRAPKKKISVLKILLGTAAVLFIVWFLIGFFGVGEAKAEEYYKYCEIAHIYGVTSIYAGSDGYGPWLDNDHDGVACEAGEGLAPEGVIP